MSVSVKWLAVKTASEMTYTVSGGALNSAQPQPAQQRFGCWGIDAPNHWMANNNLELTDRLQTKVKGVWWRIEDDVDNDDDAGR